MKEVYYIRGWVWDASEHEYYPEELAYYHTDDEARAAFGHYPLSLDVPRITLHYGVVTPDGDWEETELAGRDL